MREGNTPSLSRCRRLVLKIGSALLTGEEGSIRQQWLESLAEDIAHLHRQGVEILVVSSGAVALGRPVIGYSPGTLRLEEKQAAAACGQIRLVNAWSQAFARHSIAVGQVLLTLEDSENRRRYLNARNTIEALLEAKIIPVFNENDSVATAEIRFGDNDRLAARIAQMASADGLVLFSDIDGLYTANPHTTPEAEHLALVPEITPEIEAMAGGSASVHGTGGMITKLAAARIAVAAGCQMAIASGRELHPLRQLQEGARCTWFLSHQTPRNARKQWIAGSLQPSGSVTLDDGAVAALKNGKSLLPAGVIAIMGDFNRGDAVLVLDRQGKTVAKGLTAYSAANAQRILGCKSNEIETILGYKGRSALIHRDDMVLLG
jgi:glutamate 5-kinase